MLKNTFAMAFTVAIVEGEAWEEGMTSISFIRCAGEKKCVPTTFCFLFVTEAIYCDGVL